MGSLTEWLRHRAEWLRHNAEYYLLEAAERDLAQSHLGRPGPVGPRGPGPFFWRRIFVPAYRLVPWRLRRTMITAMPGSHRQDWSHTSRRGARPRKDHAETHG